MAARRGRRAPLPGWAWALLGLAVGLLVAWGTYLYASRQHPRPRKADTVANAPAKPAAQKPPTSAPAPAKPRFDFYTILPGETVLPPREPPKRDAKAQNAAPRYALQAASFGSFEEADRLKARLALNGLVATIEKIAIPGKGEFFRVRLGPYANMSELDAADKQLAALGIKPIRLKLKTGGA